MLENYETQDETNLNVESQNTICIYITTPVIPSYFMSFFQRFLIPLLKIFNFLSSSWYIFL